MLQPKVFVRNQQSNIYKHFVQRLTRCVEVREQVGYVRQVGTTPSTPQRKDCAKVHSVIH